MCWRWRIAWRLGGVVCVKIGGENDKGNGLRYCRSDVDCLPTGQE